MPEKKKKIVDIIRWIISVIVLFMLFCSLILKNPISSFLHFILAFYISPLSTCLSQKLQIRVKRGLSVLIGIILFIASFYAFVFLTNTSLGVEDSSASGEREAERTLVEAEASISEESVASEEEIIEEEPTKELKVYFFDVGQGDCTLVESEGQYLLIDAGLDDCGTKIQKYLMDLGVTKIDYWVLTHPDSDHIGSADVIATKFDIGKIYMSSYIQDSDAYYQMIEAFSANNLGWSIPSEGDSWALGDAETLVIHSKEYTDTNNSSLCIKVSCGEESFLFTGDAEEPAEMDMISVGTDLAATVLHLSHHGSYTASSQAFLDAVNPKYSVVSCQKNNMYGHPHQETLDKLREMGIALFRTDLQGTITATLVDDGIEWSISPLGDYKGGSSELEKSIRLKEACTNSQDVSKGETSTQQVTDDSTLTRGGIVGTEVGDDEQKENTDQPQYLYIGNKTNMKLHRMDCTGKLPEESNREYFTSLEEALAAGYTSEEQCHICKPYDRPY